MIRLIAKQQLHGKSYGPVSAGEEFSAHDMEGRILVAKGMAYRAKDPPPAPVTAATPRPSPVAGPEVTLSASPAAQASPQTSAKKSGNGVSKKSTKAKKAKTAK